MDETGLKRPDKNSFLHADRDMLLRKFILWTK